jgi:hypothetical protein
MLLQVKAVTAVTAALPQSLDHQHITQAVVVVDGLADLVMAASVEVMVTILLSMVAQMVSAVVESAVVAAAEHLEALAS